MLKKNYTTIPNINTPNLDGKNELFYLVVSQYREFELQIFDRWGELIYESVITSEGWVGAFIGSVMPIDVYVYRLKIRSINNIRIHRGGSINLIR